MPFRFKKKESVAKAVRRLCAERLDDALETLERGARLQAVHNVRKEIKKLRSVLRLIRREIGKPAYARHTRALRQAANLLTAFRDAQVKLNACDDLMKRSRRRPASQSCPEIKAALQRNCRAEERKLARPVASLKDILTSSKERFDDLKIESKGWQAIEPGLKNIYRRGRESYETARDRRLPEDFHEWRKRVKDLWHQLRLLSPTCPRHLRDRIRQLETLGNLLGDDHDLFLFDKFIARQFKQSQSAKTFYELIGSRQQGLRSAALKLGRKFYRERPGRFCRRVEDYWKTWRNKG